MAKIIQEIEYRADTRKAENASRKLEKRMEEMFSRSAMQAVAFNKALELGQKALTAVIGLLKEGAAAALEWEKTTVKLRTVLEATGHEVDQNTIALDKQSDALEALLGVSDETIRGWQTMALTMGKTAPEVDKMIRASKTLAATMAGRGGGEVPLVMAMRMIAEVEETGLVPQQLKVNKAFQDLTETQLKNLDVTQRILDVYGEEFLQKSLETTSTNVDRLARAWENVWEAMFKIESGGVVDSVLGKFESTFNSIAKSLERKGWQDYFQAAAGGGLGGIFGAVLGGMGGAAGAEGALTGVGGAAAGLTPEQFTLTQTAAAPKGKGRAGVKKYIPGAEAEGLGVDYGIWSDEAVAARQSRADAIVAIDMGLAARLLEINEIMNDDLKAAMEKDAAEQAAIRQMWMNKGLQVFQGFSNAALDVAARMAEGEDVAMGEVVKAFLRGTGRQLIGQGTMDVFKGISRGLSSYGLDPTAYALLTLGGTEIGAGTAMFAGSLALPPSNAGGGGARGGGAAYAPGSIGGTGGASAGGGDQIININISGIMTSAEAGREIQRQINDARRQGLI